MLKIINVPRPTRYINPLDLFTNLHNRRKCLLPGKTYSLEIFHAPDKTYSHSTRNSHSLVKIQDANVDAKYFSYLLCYGHLKFFRVRGVATDEEERYQIHVDDCA